MMKRHVGDIEIFSSSVYVYLQQCTSSGIQIAVKFDYVSVQICFVQESVRTLRIATVFW